MKVLLIFPQKDGQTGVAIRTALEKEHDVVTIDPNINPTNITTIATKTKPRLIICSRTISLATPVYQIKQQLPGTTICVWNTDVRPSLKDWAAWLPLFKQVHYYFGSSPYDADMMRQINPSSYYLPQGLQDDVYGIPKTAITRKDIDKYACDVSFIGDIHQPIHAFRQPYITALIKSNLKFKIWGSENQPQIYGEDHNKAVILSTINLGLSTTFNGKATGSCSVRNYKIMGTGGFLLEHYSKALEQWFPLDAKHCIFGTFTSPANMIKKIERYINNDGLRRQIALRGLRWARRNTYTHRIQQMLDIMGLK